MKTSEICLKCARKEYGDAPIPEWRSNMEHFNSLWGPKVCGVDKCPYDSELGRALKKERRR